MNPRLHQLANPERPARQRDLRRLPRPASPRRATRRRRSSQQRRPHRLRRPCRRPHNRFRRRRRPHRKRSPASSHVPQRWFPNPAQNRPRAPSPPPKCTTAPPPSCDAKPPATDARPNATHVRAVPRSRASSISKHAEYPSQGSQRHERHRPGYAFPLPFRTPSHERTPQRRQIPDAARTNFQSTLHHPQNPPKQLGTHIRTIL